MPRSSILLALTATLAASAALPAHADQVFNRIATFAVAENLPADADKKAKTSAEIISASEDGNTLVYSDSPYGAVGFVDITDPKAPKGGGLVKIDGDFVRSITTNDDDQIFVRRLAELARDLGIETVAEWVQDEASVCLLVGWGVQAIQGDISGEASLDPPFAVVRSG